MHMCIYYMCTDTYMCDVCVCGLVVVFFFPIEQLFQRVVLPGLNNILPERNILEKVKFKIHKSRLGGVNFLGGVNVR